MDVIPLFGQPLEGKTAGEIMTRNVITASLENTVGEAMKLMVEKHIHRGRHRGGAEWRVDSGRRAFDDRHCARDARVVLDVVF